MAVPAETFKVNPWGLYQVSGNVRYPVRLIPVILREPAVEKFNRPTSRLHGRIGAKYAGTLREIRRILPGQHR
jgi:hypothetical protein